MKHSKVLKVVPFFFSFLFLSIYPKSSVYFSPQDNIKNVVLSYIQSEEKSIKAAVYWITDKEIINALAEASKRDIDVEIVVDKETLTSYIPTLRKNLGKLQDAGVKVYIYSALYGTMHNKFCIFEKNKWVDLLEGKPRSIVYTGSYNWTWKANYVNQENVLFIDNKSVVSKYEQRFEKIKKEIVTQLDQYQSNIRDKKKSGTRSVKHIEDESLNDGDLIEDYYDDDFVVAES